MTNLEVGAPMPGSIGLCADEYKRVQQLRLLMEKETDAVKARESEIKNHIINSLSKSDDTGAAGKFYRAQIVMKAVPKIANWGGLTSWIRKHDRFDVLQKRLFNSAIEDLWEQQQEVPGVERVNVPDVSITKI